MNLRDLDWKTSSRDARIAGHWRVLVCAAAASLISTMIWRQVFPHAFWFFILWSGIASGGSLGFLAGAFWQLRDKSRVASTSAKYMASGIFGLGLFALIAVFLMAPDLRAQEFARSAIRSLAADNVSAISIEVAGRAPRRVDNPDRIASFVGHAKNAELFYPSHEVSTSRFHLTVHLKNGSSLDFDGGVPAHHQDDLSLDFHGYFAWNQLIVPGGRSWLDVVFAQNN